MFTARPHAIAFEAANPRHAHEWAIFEQTRLPDGKPRPPGQAAVDPDVVWAKLAALREGADMV